MGGGYSSQIIWELYRGQAAKLYGIKEFLSCLFEIFFLNFLIKRENFLLFYFSVFCHESSIEQYDGLEHEDDNILDLENNESQQKDGEFTNWLTKISFLKRLPLCDFKGVIIQEKNFK